MGRQDQLKAIIKSFFWDVLKSKAISLIKKIFVIIRITKKVLINRNNKIMIWN